MQLVILNYPKGRKHVGKEDNMMKARQNGQKLTKYINPIAWGIRKFDVRSS